MQKIKTFFVTLFRSCFDPSYYRDVLRAPHSFSLKYFVLFMFLLGMVEVFPAIQAINKFDHQDFATQAVSMYPRELEITLDRSGLEINQPLPYAIPFPNDSQDRKVARQEVDQPVNMIVFVDESAVTGLDQLRSYNAVAVVTQNDIFMFRNSPSGEVRVYEMPEVEERMVINRAVIEQLKTNVLQHPFLQQRHYVWVLSIPLVLFATLGLTVSQLFSVLFYALIVWFLARLVFRYLDLTYKKTYQVLLHAITLPLIIQYLVALHGRFAFEGSLFSIALIIWGVFLVHASKSEVKIIKSSTTRGR